MPTITYPLSNPIIMSNLAVVTSVTSPYYLSTIFRSADTSPNPVPGSPSNPSFVHYHNMSMGSGLSARLASAIANPYYAGTNMSMENWLGYTDKPYINLDIDIQNQTNGQPSQCDLGVKLYIIDSNSTLNLIINNVVGPGGAISFSNYATSVRVDFDTVLQNWGYFLVLDITGQNAVNPGVLVNNLTANAYDTDGVGQDQNRSIQPYPAFPNNGSGGRNPIVFDSMSPNAPDPTYAMQPIAINKRTAIQFYFQ